MTPETGFRAYTVECPGVVRPGIELLAGAVVAGAPCVPYAPPIYRPAPGATVHGDVLVRQRGADVLVLLRDHGGDEGGTWLVRGSRSAHYWDDVVAASALPGWEAEHEALRAADRRHVMCFPIWRLIAVGKTADGRQQMLGAFTEGASIDVVRAPAPPVGPFTITVRLHNGAVEAFDPLALARARASKAAPR